ncbi:hypothetical protein Slin15195_G048680 [Septoria linicola]|uniref:Uncharacterized protein n=1 Tax=Septoria linicola TaxID=215465 RepID=A0A9Q9ANP1_9PEZI|nr:hypothetical protein Slin15195_G048680 [Septoria linicola]
MAPLLRSGKTPLYSLRLKEQAAKKDLIQHKQQAPGKAPHCQSRKRQPKLAKAQQTSIHDNSTSSHMRAQLIAFSGSTSAANRVFAIAELLEHILLYVASSEYADICAENLLPTGDLRVVVSPVVLERVNTIFCSTIRGSHKLQSMILDSVVPPSWRARAFDDYYNQLDWPQAPVTFDAFRQRKNERLTIELDVSEPNALRAWLQDTEDQSWRNVDCCLPTAQFKKIRVKVLLKYKEKKIRAREQGCSRTKYEIPRPLVTGMFESNAPLATLARVWELTMAQERTGYDTRRRSLVHLR